jgi:urea carboxylase
MLYTEEKYYMLGEQFLAVDFGDEGRLIENIYSLSVADKLKRKAIEGIIDILPLTCSLMVSYNPVKVSASEIVHEMKVMTKEVRSTKAKITIPSKLITLPVLYNDKWTRECAEQHNVAPNLEIAAEYNNTSTDQFINIHSSQRYWVKSVGFSPGLAGFISLTPERELRAPKYKKPRTWTPARTLALGGNSNTIYPSEVPGGLQMLGRTPLPVFDIERRNPVFRDGPALLRSGSRIKFYQIDEKEYEQIESNRENYKYDVEEGNFEFEMGGES